MCIRDRNVAVLERSMMEVLKACGNLPRRHQSLLKPIERHKKKVRSRKFKIVAPRTSETAQAFLMVSDSVFFEPRSVSAVSDSLLGPSKIDLKEEAVQSRMRIRKIKDKKVAPLPI